MKELLENLLQESLLIREQGQEISDEQLMEELAVPEILPCSFDVTIPGWLERIKLWGKITFKHQDPEKFWGKKRIIIDKFIEGMETDEDLNRKLFKWRIEKINFTSCAFIKDYLSLDGKQYTEKYIVEVELKKELKKIAKHLA